MKKPLILLAGAYGYGNIGDDAIGIAIQRLLGKTAPDAEIVILGGEPSRQWLLNGAKGRHLRWKSPLKAAALVLLVKRASAVLIGGGGLLSDLSHFYRPYYTLALTANALRTPVMFYAVGAYPPHTRVFRELTPRVLGRAAVVTVRDDFSMKAFESMGVRADVTLAPDPAITLGLPLRPVSRRDDNRPLIGVSVRSLPRGDAPPDHVVELAKSLAGCLDAVVETTDARLRLLPMHFGGYDDDERFQKRVVSLMSRKETVATVSSRDPMKVFSAIGECYAVIGMRLHSNVLATAAGVPSIALVYDPKVREFMRQLDCEDRAFDIDDLTPSKVAKEVASLLDKRQAAVAQMQERMKPMLASALLSAQIAARVSGASADKSERRSTVAEASI